MFVCLVTSIYIQYTVIQEALTNVQFINSLHGHSILINDSFLIERLHLIDFGAQ